MSLDRDISHDPYYESDPNNKKVYYCKLEHKLERNSIPYKCEVWMHFRVRHRAIVGYCFSIAVFFCGLMTGEYLALKVTENL